MITRSTIKRVAVMLLVIAMPIFTFAKANGGGSSITIETPNGGYSSATLTVTGPDDESYTATFRGGQPVTFNLDQMPGTVVADGQYSYSVQFAPNVPSHVSKQLANARAAGDDKAAAKILKANGVTLHAPVTGSFQVLNGSIVDTNATEADANDARFNTSNNATTTAGGSTLSGPGGRFQVETQAQVIPDDLIVQGSECVGIDCTATESFGFDTIRLKENNLRIKAEDTSTSTGFPTTDWQLTFNDSASGGASKFSVDDVTNAKTPFTVEANAPNNTLYVDSTGRIGIQQASPVLDVHVTTGNTPAMRLEQTNSGGFTAQTWDIGANEANFFVRDVTGGSRLPFRIRPGAPTSSVDIAASGDVGVGTASPTEKLHVFENVDANSYILLQNSNAGTSANATLGARSDVAGFDVKVHASSRTISRFGKTLGGWNELVDVAGNGVILGTLTATPLVLGTNSTNRLEIGAAGGVTITGNLTVTGVKNFAHVDPADSSKALYYVALEGPEAGTYFRGSARTVNGEAVIELPGYFSRITEGERMTVQLTATGKWGQVYVASKTPERLVIKVPEGAEDMEFDYFVQGVRKGYLNYEVERENKLPN